MQIQEGLYLVDKPSGVTSHDIVSYFRRQSGIKRIGHTGTLDPLATGLLILLVGRQFTKRQSEFLKQDKEYLVTAKLGSETDTYDIDGKIIQTVDFKQLKKIEKETILKELESFRGQIKQTVPAFSAVKVAGRKLYEQSRKGVKIANLPSRQVEIKKLDLLDFKLDGENKELLISLRVFCSSGTYIRSLVHDLGQKLTVGATVIKLRRTKIAELKVEDAIVLTKEEVKRRRDSQPS